MPIKVDEEFIIVSGDLKNKIGDIFEYGFGEYYMVIEVEPLIKFKVKKATNSEVTQSKQLVEIDNEEFANIGNRPESRFAKQMLFLRDRRRKT